MNTNDGVKNRTHNFCATRLYINNSRWSMVDSLCHRSFFSCKDITLSVCEINQPINSSSAVETVQHIAINSPRTLW